MTNRWRDRCACCDGVLTVVRSTREDSREYGVVEVENWRCADCRAGGHRAYADPDGDDRELVHIAGPALDYHAAAEDVAEVDR